MIKNILGCAMALLMCASPAFAGLGMHTSVKIQATGINMNAGTGMTAGYLAGTVDRAPVTDSNGKAISGTGCSFAGVNTFANLNSNATASAGNIPAGVAGAVVSNITNPSIAFASGDMSANGDAAVIASAIASGKSADVLAAECNHTVMPAAAPGSIVRDGVSPK